INAAGRSSGHHAYRRLVLDQLPAREAMQTRASLATLMGLLKYDNGHWFSAAGEQVDDLHTTLMALDPVLKAGTLIRKLENNLFDPDNLLFHTRAVLQASDDQPVTFTIKRQHLPEQIPLGWLVSEAAPGYLRVEIPTSMEILTENFRKSPVNSAGQLPSGFDPRSLYQSRNHPRGLQLTVFGASDAVQSLGIDWETVLKHVPADQISVYAGSSMSQMDYDGNGGLLQ